MRMTFVLVTIFVAATIIGLRAQAPSGLPGCQYNASLPTLTTRQTTVLQCDSSGKLLLH